MPIDIQVLINDGEIGLAMLRIIEIIGEDELKNLGSKPLFLGKCTKSNGHRSNKK